jgi:leucyl aminopeptidase
MGKSGFAKAQSLAAQAVGPLLKQAAAFGIKKVQIDFLGSGADVELGFLVGWEAGRYQFSSVGKSTDSVEIHVTRSSESFGSELLHEACALSEGLTLARHLTNLPGADLNPKSFADAVEGLFAKRDNLEVQVWSGEDLDKERCGLLKAVGGGAQEGPRLVVLRYRPPSTIRSQPVAIVGKGITFDSGGLDIKPSSAMRLMKKDMGGAAAAVGVLKWAVESELDVPLDVYLALAENAVGPGSFRPGDIVTARNGLKIEIHNTDAEGRLVLADALDLAAEGKPSHIVNLATLTGAIKVALGADVAGLFSNDDQLAAELHNSGLATGDLNWRMPLFPPYKAMLRSPFADHVNAADGFAGAITAALFLELFVRKTPWAHLDIYAWRDGAGGAQSEPGGSGQGVLCLSHWLSNLGTEIVDQDHE